MKLLKSVIGFLFILFYTFGRGIVLGLCIYTGIMALALCLYFIIKKYKAVYFLLLFLIVTMSIFVPLRMYVFKQQFVPEYSFDNPSVNYQKFYDMYIYGQQQRLVDSSILSTNEYRSDYESETTDNNLYMDISIWYCNEENDHIRSIKKDYAKCGEKDGIKYWETTLSSDNFSWYSSLTGVIGTILLENQKGEMLIVSFTIRNFKGASNIFNTYPKEFDKISNLTECTILK
ncbi:MAG: hypothetical protein ACOX45_08045 [Acutalibacteraceae bacterium]